MSLSYSFIQFLSADAGPFLPVESPHILYFGMASFPGVPTWFLTDGGLVSLDPDEVIVAPMWIENAPVFLSSDPRGNVNICMRKRAEDVGGAIFIDGTTVELHMPLY